MINEKEILKQGNLPAHIAIIMDGNGRWAKKRGLPRVAGHREGIKSVREIVEVCGEIGVQVLTLYTFSTENWNRPRDEVSALMRLLIQTLRKEIADLMKNNVRVTAIGDLERMPEAVRKEFVEGIDATKDNTGLTLNLALNYGSREEILSAIRHVVADVQNNAMDMEQINSESFSKYLYTASLPDPDLIIRTSGEFRISNFLLWQAAYSEFYITDVFWPDFRRDALFEAIQSYQGRERRFGRVSEQLA
ncbi:isoprenyl transferase [candidate division KSB1 bacterium]|nr:isoprenyl transferase [candidate division KSB1 bacterium]